MSCRYFAIKTLLALLLLGLVAGCGKGAGRSKTETFFVDWLKSHGETHVVVDAGGVGIAGNATRLKARLFGAKENQGGSYTVEMEFRVHLPSGGQIVEFVVGMGKTQEEAIQDSLLNFMLTTFHVVYKSFMNPADPHQKVYAFTVNGKKREMMMGDIYVRGDTGKEPLDFEGLRGQIRTTLASWPLSPQPHWIKIVCGHAPGKAPYVSATVNNEEQAGLTAALTKLKWPGADKGYLMKEFIVVK